MLFYVGIADSCLRSFLFFFFVGHEVIFSLETASDYVKDEKASFYGFKCSIVGYEWSTKPEEVCEIYAAVQIMVIIITKII